MVANLLLKEYTGDVDATLFHAVRPVNIKYPDPNESFRIAVYPMFGYSYFFGMMPLFLYLSLAIKSDRDSDQRRMGSFNRMSRFLSWLISGAKLNLIISLGIAVPLKLTVLSSWGFLLMFLMFFLGG